MQRLGFLIWDSQTQNCIFVLSLLIVHERNQVFIPSKNVILIKLRNICLFFISMLYFQRIYYFQSSKIILNLVLSVYYKRYAENQLQNYRHWRIRGRHICFLVVLRTDKRWRSSAISKYKIFERYGVWKNCKPFEF